jgi:hypothetical protein
MAPATFQRIMNVILSRLTGSRCFVFLGNTVVCARTLAEPDKIFRHLFDKIRGNKLKLKTEKCQFLRREMCYFGHVICEDGVRPDPSKVKVVV